MHFRFDRIRGEPDVGAAMSEIADWNPICYLTGPDIGCQGLERGKLTLFGHPTDAW